MTLTTDLFKDSWLYQDGLHEGEAAGLVKGEAVGRRASIAQILGNRFPSVSADRLAAVTDSSVLGDVLIAIANARDEAEAQAVLDRL